MTRATAEILYGSREKYYSDDDVKVIAHKEMNNMSKLTAKCVTGVMVFLANWTNLIMHGWKLYVEPRFVLGLFINFTFKTCYKIQNNRKLPNSLSYKKESEIYMNKLDSFKANAQRRSMKWQSLNFYWD